MPTKPKKPIRITLLLRRIIVLALAGFLIYISWGVREFDLTYTPAKPMHIRAIEDKQNGSLGLKYPQGIAANATKNWLYVTSAQSGRVVVFDEDYKPKFSFGDNVLKTPVFIAVNKGGQVYITDRALKGIFVFSSNGNFIKKLKLAEISNPLGVAVDDQDNIYITDTGHQHRVLKYNQQGKLLLKFGYKKRAIPITSAKGGFFFPNGLAVDKKQNIYVADSNNGRLQIFDSKGNFKSLIITGGLPRGVAINEKANALVIVDALRHKILTYNIKTGKTISSSSQLGSGEADIAFPNSLVLTGKESENLLIVDRENSRLQLFKSKLSMTDIGYILRPYLPFLPLPMLGLMLLFLFSRRRRYILSDCFFDEVLKDHTIEDLQAATKTYHIAPAFYKDLQDHHVFDKITGRLFHNMRYNHYFAEKVQAEHKLTQAQAETLAIAHHRGIYRPVLLACDKKLQKAAEEYDIETINPGNFFKKDK